VAIIRYRIGLASFFIHLYTLFPMAAHGSR
jgi:hypothetical protein